MMLIQFLGVGSLFSGKDQCNSNIVITSPSGKKMLIDCGSDARYSLAEQNILPGELDAVYISHLHSDHIGGLEWLALCNFFDKDTPSLQLFGEAKLLNRLWENSLKGGLECIGRGRKQLADYFDCHPLDEQDRFSWEKIQFNMMKMPHVTGCDCHHFSYGLVLRQEQAFGTQVFISTDTTFQPELLQELAVETDLIFHDCETSTRRTSVHTHYEQLRTLPHSVRKKMWLYHYQPGSGYSPQEDGFLGFVQKGQSFTFQRNP